MESLLAWTATQFKEKEQCGGGGLRCLTEDTSLHSPGVLGSMGV